MTSIAAGDHLLVRDAHDHKLRVRAASEIEVAGHNFPVVWIERPLADGTTDLVPWPLDAVALRVREVEA